ncbi:MAG: DUF4340 domain-containing protein [Clostridiaceae bacterium]|nr:DUF4340 domain-containing protein [Clostridiaceae bacterium]
MKQKRKIIILSVVLAVLIVALTLVSVFNLGGKPKQTTGTTLSSEQRAPVLQVKKEEVRSIEVFYGDNHLVYLASSYQPTLPPVATNPAATASPTPRPTPQPDVAWTLQGYEDARVNESLLKSTAEGLLVVSNVQEITDNSDNLAQFGLESSKNRIIYTLKNGNKHEVLIGKEVPGASQFYARDASNSRVCTVTSVVDRMQNSILDYLDKKIIPFPVEDWATIELKRKADQFDFVARAHPYDPTPADPNDRKSDEHYKTEGQIALYWDALRPMERKVDVDNLQTLVSQLINLSAVNFVEYNPSDLARYGLNDPAYSIVLTDGSRSLEIKIGDASGDGNFYAIASNNDAVFRVSSDATANLDVSPERLFDRWAALQGIFHVKKLTATYDGNTYVAEIFVPTPKEEEKDDTLEENFILNGADANVTSSRDKSYFKEWYTAIIGILADGLDLENEPDLSAAPDFHFHYEHRNGDPDKDVKLYKRDEHSYFMVVDDEYIGMYYNASNLTDQRASTLGLYPATERLLTAMEKAVDGVYDFPEN